MQGQCNFFKGLCTIQLISKTLRYLSLDIAMCTAARLKMNITAFCQLLQNWPNKAHLHGPSKDGAKRCGQQQENTTPGMTVHSYLSGSSRF